MTKIGEHRIPLPTMGLCNVRNKGAMSWKNGNLAAVANGSDIHIIDTVSLESVQVLSGHKSSVVHLLWIPSGRQLSNDNKFSNRDLISADSSNQIIVWDALRGQTLFSYVHPDTSRQLLDMHLPTGCDNWVQFKVYLLYTGNLLVIFDHGDCNFHEITFGSKRASNLEPMTEYFAKFALDYHHSSVSTCQIAFAASDTTSYDNISHISVCKSWDYVNDSRITIHDRVSLAKNNANIIPQSSSRGSLALSASPSLQSLSDAQNSDTKVKRQSSSSIRKLVSDIIVGQDPSSSAIQQNIGHLNVFIQFHQGLRDFVVLGTESDIYLINIKFGVLVNTFSIDKGASPFVSIICAKSRPCVYTLHENGTLLLRKYILSGDHNVSMQLETICANENPRFPNKKTQVLACILDPFSESRVLVHLSDARILRYELVASITPKSGFLDHKHVNTPSTPCVRNLMWEQPQEKVVGIRNECKKVLELAEIVNSACLPEMEKTVKMKLTRITNSLGQLTCLKARNDTLVAGNTSGFLVVINMKDEAVKIEKKFAIHSNSPVSGIEFISDQELLCYSNSHFSASPKCELVITELQTGDLKVLKNDDNFHIQAVSISPLKQYFIIVYKNGAIPCELWDLPRRQKIKTLPSKLPPITCVTWKEPTEKSNKEEIFYLTDLGTFLFTFRVEGNRFTNATCVKLDTGTISGIPIKIFNRGELVFRADASCTLVVYNTTKKTASSGISIGKGPLLHVEPIDRYFVAHFLDNVELWDSNDIKKVSSLHHGKLKAQSVAVVGKLVAYIPKNSNGIRFLPLKVYPGAIVKSPIIPAHTYLYFLESREKAEKIFTLASSAGSSVEDVIELAKHFSAMEEYEFWKLTQSKWYPSHLDSMSESCKDFYNGGDSKEYIVKIAQCVWTADDCKRDEIGKFLLSIGELDKAAEILLDAEPSDVTSYILNGLKASLSVGSETLPESTKAVLKVVATNLIASGEMEKGLELLCILGKHYEACKYLESVFDWSNALLMSKLSLPTDKKNETLTKYAQYLNSKKCIIQSASMYVIMGNFDKAIEIFFGSRVRHMSYLLLHFYEKSGFKCALSEHVKLAIKLDFARFLFDNRLMRESIDFCERLGTDGKSLKQELEILAT